MSVRIELTHGHTLTVALNAGDIELGVHRHPDRAPTQQQYLTLTPTQARELAKTLLEAADKVEPKR